MKIKEQFTGMAEVSQKTLQRIEEEIELMFELFEMRGGISAAIGHDISVILREFTHWVFDKTGEHPSPAEFLAQQMVKADEFGANKWESGADMTTKKEGSKTND